MSPKEPRVNKQMRNELGNKKPVILLNEIIIYLIHSPRQLVFSNWGDYFMNTPTPTLLFL